MAPKTITVVDSSGTETSESVANDLEFKALIDDHQVRFLKTADSPPAVIRGFESLKHGGTYTLGPQGQSLQQEPKASMTTPWDKINVDGFRAYLTTVGYTADEFNAHPNRTALFNSFEEYQRQQPKSYWFKVSGAISRPLGHAGARYKLYKLASAHRGLYPPTDDDSGANKKNAFSNAMVDADRSMVSFTVVFQELGDVATFINGITLYLMENKDQLVLLNEKGRAIDEPPMTEISTYPIDQSFFILQTHYQPQSGEADPGSPLIDMIVDVRSSDITVDVTLLSRRNPVFRFQRIENDNSFGMADPESAHIFPSAKCLGIYEWLERPEFNRLALSRDVHLNFDGTGRGRGKRRKTQQTFAIRPLRPVNGYTTCTVADVQCYKIPLELVLNVNEIGETLLTKLGKNAALHKHNGSRWTIDGSDVTVYHPTGRRVFLKTEQTDNGSLSLVTGIPGLEDLNDCWSNSPTNSYDVEAAEIMEKCPLWNYQNALKSWSLV